MANNPYVNKVVTADGRTLIDISGDTVAANKMLSGTTAHSKSGAPVTGSIGSKAAATYNVSATDQTIAAGQYLSGAQTIRKVTTSGISAANIRSGATVQVGDAGSGTRIANVAGTFTKASTATGTHGAAVAANILNGYSAWVNGAEVIGTFDMFALTVDQLKALSL